MKTKITTKPICLAGAFLLTLLFNLNGLRAQQLAFPGAEGFGRYTTGGRGGEIYHVTNLNDSGEGSFRDAVSKSNRTVVFDVGGVINISSRIVIQRNITIAGQTAPGGGITIYGDGIALNGDSGNDIIRYIRIRMGKNGTSNKDAVSISEGTDYMFDHVSISWGRDGTLDVNGTGIDNLSFQDCIISQGINNLNHSTGGLMQSGKWSMIRSLYIDNKTRNPKARGTHEFINSVLYNWGTNGYIMGDTEGVSECNLIGNYFIYGPSSSSNTHITNTTPTFYVYAEDNWVDSDKDGVLDGYKLTDYKTATVMSSPFSYPGVNNKLSAQDALSHVINNVGASLVRDEVDKLLINQLLSYGTAGSIINTEDDNGISGNVGTVAHGETPMDSDQDGMPDSWELANGMDPFSADNNGDIDGDSYTNIEEYLDWLVNGTTPLPAELIKHGTGSSSQTVEVNTPIEEFYYNWTNANTVTVSGLPTGVTATINTSAQTVTISGTPFVTGTFDYTITTVGGSPNASVTQTLTVTGTSSSIKIQENATGFCAVDGTIDNNNAGFTGDGFANTYNASGNGIDYKLNFSTSGTYTFTFMYASTSDRPANIIIDGSTAVSSLNFPSTGAWTTWKTVSASAYVNAGTYNVRLEATGSSGLANIDYMMVSGESASAASCKSVFAAYRLSTDVIGNGTVSGAGTYDKGTVVTLIATAATSNIFAGWSGDASGTSSTTTVTMDSDKSITATFEAYKTDGCDSPTTISLPFTQNGIGEYCWQTTEDINYIYSWALDLLEINGMDYTNTWSNNLPAKQDGYYNIHYIGSYGWSNFEIASVKSTSMADQDFSLTAVPNPFGNSTSVRFNVDTDQKITISIHDMTGKMVRLIENNIFPQGNHLIQVNKDELEQGIYLLKLHSGSRNETLKLIVE